jgi:metal-sulfur cluster biosynthetic enzyme|tara:strand:- start:1626 stop:1907 length:282 start_codon:yes stop_codon:yes gene_type:complete
MTEINHEKIEALGELYDKTGDDWTLTVHHTLTEPTCPTAVVCAEGSNAVRYRVDADTIEEAINRSVDLAHRELILGEEIKSECPFTNPDDHKA